MLVEYGFPERAKGVRRRPGGNDDEDEDEEEDDGVRRRAASRRVGAEGGGAGGDVGVGRVGGFDRPDGCGPRSAPPLGAGGRGLQLGGRSGGRGRGRPRRGGRGDQGRPRRPAAPDRDGAGRRPGIPSGRVPRRHDRLPALGPLRVHRQGAERRNVRWTGRRRAGADIGPGQRTRGPRGPGGASAPRRVGGRALGRWPCSGGGRGGRRGVRHVVGPRGGRRRCRERGRGHGLRQRDALGGGGRRLRRHRLRLRRDGRRVRGEADGRHRVGSRGRPRRSGRAAPGGHRVGPHPARRAGRIRRGVRHGQRLRAAWAFSPTWTGWWWTPGRAGSWWRCPTASAPKWSWTLGLVASTWRRRRTSLGPSGTTSEGSSATDAARW